jgi:antitoxin HigA-1
MAIKMHNSFAIHPGSWLRTEIIDAHEMSVTEAAQRLGISRQALTNLLTCKTGLSAEMAIRFEKVFSTPADALLRIQLKYELAKARANEDQIEVQPIAA